MSLQRVLITGGAGFIGSNLAGRLLDRGVAVNVLDNLDPFYDVTLKRRNLDGLQQQGGTRFSFAAGDIRDAAACRAALHGCDVVVHLAALAGVRPSIQDPVRYADCNVTGTQVLLQQIDSKQVRFVFGSSSSVYGGSTKVPFREDDPVASPVSPYAATKRAGELLCHAFHHLRGNDVACLRFFTVYGPRQRPDMAIHRFVAAIAAGKPITMFGDGSSRRDYTFIDDIVAGVVAAIERVAPAAYGIYNLGNTATISLAELVALIEVVVGRAAVVERVPDQPGDVPVTYADITRASGDLGYQPTTTVEVGIRRFWDWFRTESK